MLENAPLPLAHTQLDVHRLCTAVDKRTVALRRGCGSTYDTWEGRRPPEQRRSLATRMGHHNGSTQMSSRCDEANWDLACAILDRAPPPARPRRCCAPARVRFNDWRLLPEAHVSAEEALPAQNARLSHPHVHAWRAAGAQGAAAQGSQAPDTSQGEVNRRHRLSGRRAFAAVRAQHISSTSGPLRVHLAANRLLVARAGFVVPKDVGGAVVRNRVRRRLRAALTPRLPELGGLDLIVRAAPAAARLTAEALDAHLGSCLVAASAKLRGRTAAGIAPPPPALRLLPA